jgi:uncharacterized membrane protein
MIDTLLLNLSNNKIFSGCILLLTNIGGRYLAIDFPKNVDAIFNQFFILRCLVLFSVFFMATRDIKTSILLTLFFFIIIHFFINENSTFCLINKDVINKKEEYLNKKISPDEYLKAKEIINKYHLESNK